MKRVISIYIQDPGSFSSTLWMIMEPLALQSLSGDTMTVSLTRPQDEEEECPLTLESMSKYDLEFIPGATLLKAHPELKKMTLPCNHSFSAMACVYHFCKLNMLCPICRQGIDSALDVGTLEEQIREPMKTRLEAQRREDLQASDSEGQTESVALFIESLQTDLALYADLHRIFLVVYCYTQPEALVPMVQLEYFLRCPVSEGSVEFELPDHMVRQMNLALNRIRGLFAVEFAVGIRTITREFVFLDRSSKVPVQSLSSQLLILGRGMAQFRIRVNKVEEDIYFSSWEWTCSLESFGQIMMITPVLDLDYI